MANAKEELCHPRRVEREVSHLASENIYRECRRARSEGGGKRQWPDWKT